MAGVIEHVEHRAILRDHEFDARVPQPHAECFGRQQPAGAEGFIAQIRQRAAGRLPGVAGRIEHPHRAAEQGHGICRQSRKGGVEIEPAIFITGMDDEAIAEQGRELVQIGRLAA